jgi:hypothetical protein
MSKLLENNNYTPRLSFLGEVLNPIQLAQSNPSSIADPKTPINKKAPAKAYPKTRVTGNAGIYKIECHVENSVYIGQSVNIDNRITNHRSSLRAGKHICASLQADFKKHGEANFIFEAIHESDDQNLLDLETFYIQKHRDEGFEIYNSVTFTNNIGMVQCNKDNQAILQKISDLMDSGKVKKGELEEALFYKQTQW